MSDFGALAYLEGRQIANTAKDIVRKPQRLLIYLFVVLYFVFLIWTRTLSHNHAVPGVPDPWAALIGLGAILLAGYAIVRAADGNVAAFASAAEARFLIGSRMSERNVAVWLQLRNSARTLLRLLFVIILYAILFHGAGGPLAIALTMTCAIVAGIAMCIPVFKLSRRIGKAPVAITGWVVVGLAAASMIATLWVWFVSQSPSLHQLVTNFALGFIVKQALLGNPVVLGTGFLIDALLVGLAYFGASDIYPELNVGSARYIAAMARARRGALANLGRSKTASTTVRSVSAPSGFTGAAATLWKDWISFRRATSGFIAYWVVAAGSIVAGVVLGLVGQYGHEGQAMAISFGSSLGFVILVVGAMYSAVSLAGDLGKPLWWMSDSTLRARLYAWIIATGWRSAACAVVGLIAWAIVSRSPFVALAGVPLALVLTLFSRAVGLAIYALFPSALDQRGPAAIGRMLGMYVSLVPPIGAGLALGLLSNNAIAGCLAGFAVAVLELIAMIEFAAHRIRTHGVAIAQAEAA